MKISVTPKDFDEYVLENPLIVGEVNYIKLFDKELTKGSYGQIVNYR